MQKQLAAQKGGIELVVLEKYMLEKQKNEVHW